ncbi:unnamed protein product [Phaeothamnion confervicola]
MADTNQIDKEVEQLKKDITRLGSTQPDGRVGVTYGVLFDDEGKSCNLAGQQFYEALMGTLRAAKKRGVVDYKGQMLLKGANDNVVIYLLIPPE